MYTRDLDKLLIKKDLPNSILIYGQSEYLRDFYINKIIDIYKDENIVKLYFDEYDFAMAKRHLSQESLFGGQNILVLKIDKIAPKEIEILIMICTKTNNSKLIVEYFGDDMKAKKLGSKFTLKKKANFTRVFKPKTYEAINILFNESQNMGLNIDKYTLEYLYEVENSSLAKSINSLAKLQLIQSSNIGKSEIDKYIYGTSVIDLDSLTHKLFDKDDILPYMKKILANQTSDNLDILRAINKYFQNIIMFHLYIKIHGKVNVKEILGYQLPVDLSNKISSHSLKIKSQNINKILNTLCECELKLKSSIGHKNSILLSHLIKIQSFL